MKTVTRTRPVVTHPAAARIKRVRIGGAIRVQPQVVNKEDSTRMQMILKLISQGDHAAAKWTEQRGELVRELHKLMKMYRLPSLSSEYADAEVGQKRGRAVNTIDPREFHERVGDEDFYECVKVSNEKAKQYLSGKELAEITHTEPGKLGDEYCEVKARGLPDEK